MLQKQYLNGVEILSVNLNSLLDSLHEIAARIKMQHPEVVEVVLFGSFSKNNFTPCSDLDIAIVVNNTHRKFIERQDDFIEYFLDVPFDTYIVVYTSQEISQMIKSGNKFIMEIKEGKKL